MKRWIPHFLLTCIVMGLLFLAFGEVILNPNAYQFSHGGDGFKAYFSTEFYLKYGSDWTWHSAFMYPWGNHILYMDMNPLLSMLLKALLPIWDSSNDVPAIINLSMLFSLLPCAWLIFGLLRRALLPDFYAIPMAVVITFLSPQIVRMIGAYSLAWCFFVPLIWWVSLKIFESKRFWGWMILYTLIVGVCAMMHPYYGLLGAAWISGYILVHFLQNPDSRLHFRPRYILGMIMGVVPGIWVKIWGALTQRGFEDFVTNPFGFLHYRAGPETLFIPRYAPFRDVWDYFIHVKSMTIEGYAYVGLVGTLVVIASLYRSGVLFRKPTQRSRIFKPVVPNDLRVSMWVGILMLIPAMAYPFLLFPDVVDFLGPIRQFRSMGRLAWLFFYPWMVYTAWWLYSIHRVLRIHGVGGRLANLSGGMLILAIASLGLSAWSVVKAQREVVLQNHRSKLPERDIDYRKVLAEKGYQVEDFQATIILPFFHIGSEKLTVDGFEGTKFAYALALNTGLPLCNNQSARSPLTPAMWATQLASHPLVRKELIPQLPNQKPLLLAYKEGPQSPGSAELISQATPIAKTAGYQLAVLSLTAFNERTRESARAIFLDNQESLFFDQTRKLASFQPLESVAHSSFGDEPHVLGKQSMQGTPDGTTIWRGALPDTGEGLSNTRELSFWVYLDHKTNYLTYYFIRQWEQGKMISEERVLMSETYDIMGAWAKMSTSFTPVHPGVEIELFCKKQTLTIDNLLIRPIDQTVFYIDNQGQPTGINNYSLSADDWQSKRVK